MFFIAKAVENKKTKTTLFASISKKGWIFSTVNCVGYLAT